MVTAVFRRLIAKALQFQVKRLIRRQKPRIVGITGSVGKTATKLATAQILGTKYRVLAHPGNFNSQISLPLAIFNLPLPNSLKNPSVWIKLLFRTERIVRRKDYPYEVWVLELAADHMGEIRDFMRYLTPDIGIVTAVAPAHLELFGSVENILREKMLLAKGSRIALLNIDDPRIKAEGKKLTNPVAWFGLQEGDFHFSSLKLTSKGYGGQLVVDNKRLPFASHFIGEHNLYNLIAAAGAASLMNVSPTDIAGELNNIRPTAGRMNILRGAAGSLLIDDTYNASPKATLAALKSLYDIPSGRKIAILGNMNELGDYAETGHREVGKYCDRLDLLVTIGDLAADYLADEAKKHLEPAKIASFHSPYEAGRFLAGQLKKDDNVLIKGSQNGVFAEEATALLLADPADRSNLVRQSDYWQKKKLQQFPNEPEINTALLKNQKQQQIAGRLGFFMGERFCAPTCFYILAKAYGYINVDFLDFCKGLRWKKSYTRGRGWIRADLSSWLRRRYHLPIVNWMLNPAHGVHNLSLMRQRGYLGSQFEQDYFTKHIMGRSVKDLVQAGHPVIITAAAGFGGNRYLHAVVIKSWRDGEVIVADPDERNFRSVYSEAEVEKFLFFKQSVCSILIPPDTQIS